MADYINPVNKKAYSESQVTKVKGLLRDLSRLVDDGKVAEARNKFAARMGTNSKHTGFNRLDSSQRRLARMMFRDIVGDKPKDATQRVSNARAASKTAGGGGMMTPDDVVRRGRRSLFKKD